jgi:hypothetical protein
MAHRVARVAVPAHRHVDQSGPGADDGPALLSRRPVAAGGTSPAPVLARFLNGVALLALVVLLPRLFGWHVGTLPTGAWPPLSQVQPDTLVVELLTVATTLGLPRLSPHLPAHLIGLPARLPSPGWHSVMTRRASD